MEDRKKLILSLGSNLGDRITNLKLAIGRMEDYFGPCVLQSSFYETESWGFEAAPFINCCVVFKAGQPAEEVLTLTQEEERKLGRLQKTENMGYASRLIDIDILYYGEGIYKTEDLTIPHPLLYERNFVLTPLAEICPTFIDPVKKVSILELKTFSNDKKDAILYKNC